MPWEKAGQLIPFGTWVDAGLANYKEGQFNKAVTYFDKGCQLLKGSGIPIPAEVLANRNLAFQSYEIASKM